MRTQLALTHMKRAFVIGAAIMGIILSCNKREAPHPNLIAEVTVVLPPDSLPPDNLPCLGAAPSITVSAPDSMLMAINETLKICKEEGRGCLCIRFFAIRDCSRCFIPYIFAVFEVNQADTLALCYSPMYCGANRSEIDTFGYRITFKPIFPFGAPDSTIQIKVQPH